MVSQENDLNTQNYNLNCAEIEAGTYTVTINLNNGATLTKKVIIM